MGSLSAAKRGLRQRNALRARAFDVAWTVKSRHGGIMGHFVQVVHIAPGDGGSTAAAATTAKMITGAMGLTDEVPMASAGAGSAPAAARKIPSISVKPVEGAPGDGRQSLALAVLQALSDLGARRDDVNPDVVLYGKVETKPATLSSLDVTISWRAVARDGHELGTVKVENTIPNGVLDGSWGPTAFAIAAAAQQDLMRLLLVISLPAVDRAGQEGRYFNLAHALPETPEGHFSGTCSGPRFVTGFTDDDDRLILSAAF